MAQSYVFAGVGGYYGTKDKTGKAGIFRRDAAGSDWDYVLKDLEAFTVFVHPRDPNLVFAGTADGVYRSTDHGATFKRANFPDQGVQVWSFMADPADPRRMLAGGSPVAVYKSADSGENWTRVSAPPVGGVSLPPSPQTSKQANLPKKGTPALSDVCARVASESGSAANNSARK